MGKMTKKLLELPKELQQKILRESGKKTMEEVAEYLFTYSLTWSDLCSRYPQLKEIEKKSLTWD